MADFFTEEEIAQLSPQEESDQKFFSEGEIASFEPIAAEFQPNGLMNITDTQRRRWRAQGEMGFWESVTRMKAKETIPIVNILGIFDSFGLKKSAERFKASQEDESVYVGKDDLRKKDTERLNKFLIDMEETRERGYSIGGQFVRGASILPAFMVDIMVSGFIVGGLKKGAKTLAGQTAKGIASATAKKTAEQIAKKAAQSGAMKFTTKVIKGTANAAARVPFTATTSPFKGYADRRFNQMVQMTEDGIDFSRQIEESPAKTAVKAYLQSTIELGTEFAGAAIVRGIKKGAVKTGIPGVIAKSSFSNSKTAKRAASAMNKIQERLKVTKGVSEAFRTTVGLNNFVEEWTEERASAFLQAVTGVEDFGTGDDSLAPAAIFDRIMASIPDGEEALVEALVLTVPQAGKLGISKSREIIRKNKADAEAQEPGTFEINEDGEVVATVANRDLSDEVTDAEIETILAAGEEAPGVEGEAAQGEIEGEIVEEQKKSRPLSEKRLAKIKEGQRDFAIDLNEDQDKDSILSKIINNPLFFATQKFVDKLGRDPNFDKKTAISHDDYKALSDKERQERFPLWVKWLNELNSKKVPEGLENPEIIYVLGPPEAGKNAYVKDQGLEESHLEIDGDKMKDQFEDFQKDGRRAQFRQNESGHVADEIAFFDAVSKRKNIIQPKIGRTASDLKAKILEMQKLGYKVKIVLVDVSEGTSQKRAAIRFLESGRFVPRDYISLVFNPSESEIAEGKSTPAETYDILVREGTAEAFQAFTNEFDLQQQEGGVPDGQTISERSDNEGISGQRVQRREQDGKKDDRGTPEEQAAEIGEIEAARIAEEAAGVAEKKSVRRQPTTVLKNKIRDIQRGIRLGRVKTKEQIKSLQGVLTRAINAAKIQKNFKDTLRKGIPAINTVSKLDKRLPEILARIEQLEMNERSLQAVSRIDKALTQSKPKKGSKPIGKLTADTQAIIDSIRRIIKLNPEVALEEVERNTVEAADGDIDLAKRFENRLLNLVAGREGADPAFLEEVAEFVETVLATGKAEKLLKDFAQVEQDEANIEQVVQVITNNKGAPVIDTVPIEDFHPGVKGKIAAAGQDFVSWNDLMRSISFLNTEQILGEEGTEFLDVFDQELNEKVGFQKMTEQNAEEIRKIYGLKSDGDFVRKLANDSRIEVVGTFQNADGRTVEIKMTRTEAIKRWMELLDPTLQETFDEGMKFTAEIREGIDTFLTSEDKRVAEQQLAFYRRYYDRVNKVYREFYGVDLPFNEFYSPIRREQLDINDTFADILQDVRSRATTAPGSLKSRVKNIRRIKEQSYYDVMQKHIREMEHFIAYAEKIRQLKKTFSDNRVRNSIKANFGQGMLSNIDNFIQDMTRGRIQEVQSWEWLEKWRINFIKSVLPIKANISLKQLTSFPAFLDAIPAKDFTVGVLDFWKNPIKNTKILLGTDFVKTRGASFERDLALIQESDVFKRFEKRPTWMNTLLVHMEMAKRFSIKNVEIGDKGAIVMGGWSVYRYHRKVLGKSHEASVREFSKISNSTQQSSFLSEQSKLQRGGTFARLFTTFKSTPNQYFRAELNAWKGLILKKGSKIQHLKTIAIFHILLPNLFQWVSNGFDFDEEEQLRASVLGSLNGWFLIGDGLDTALRAYLGMRQWSTDIPINGVFKDLARVARFFGEDEITMEDFQSATRGLAGVAGVATGTPLKQVVDIGSGAIDLTQGQYESGLKKALGYSPFIVEQGLKDKKGSRGNTRRLKRNSRRRTRRSRGR